MNTHLKNFVEELAVEEVPQDQPASIPAPAPKVFRLGRLASPNTPEWGQTQDQDLVLLEDEDSLGQDLLADEAVPAEKKVGLTGTYSSRLFGASSKYFSSKIRKQ